jgi:DNA-binding NarL/FixJ family response regulator
MKREVPTRARIVIADDHPLFRFAIVALLRECPDFEVIGEATDGQEALKLCSRLKPDLVLMDVIMPRMGGIEAVRAIKRELPRTIVLMMTASVEPSHLAEAIKAGAAGYILKSACPEEIESAVRKALAGESPLNQEVAMRLLWEVMDGETPRAEGESLAAVPSAPTKHSEDAPSCLLESLTAREKEVLGLVVRGQTNQQIARSLLISASTAKHHVRQIISKLRVSDRTQAAVVAVRAGVLSQPGEE